MRGTYSDGLYSDGLLYSDGTPVEAYTGSSVEGDGDGMVYTDGTPVEGGSRRECGRVVTVHVELGPCLTACVVSWAAAALLFALALVCG